MRGRVLACCGALAALPAAAHAHLVTTGLGPLYDGMTHLVVSPADLLILIGAALLGGLGGPARGRSTLVALPLTWFVGGLLGLLLAAELLVPAAAAMTMVVLGVMVAADVSLSRSAAAAVVSLVGLFLGLVNGSALAAVESGPLALVGTVLAATVVALLGSALVVAARRPWMRLVVRVAGSWIAAIGVLMVGWSLRS